MTTPHSPTQTGKSIADSRFTLSALMQPGDANGYGNVHGGVIMKMADEAGAIVAMRHANAPVVTVAVDTMTFMEPILVHHLVLCTGEMTYAGRTSMEVRVEVVAEHPVLGTRKTTNIAYLVYVALDENGRPKRVPPLHVETDEQRQRAAQAEERQRQRKARAAQEQRQHHDR